LRLEAPGTGGRADGAAILAISVLDRGPGVPEADRDRIFGAFEQGGDPMTAKPAGIGIGLHEARSVARRHGGDVVFVPRNGGGSEFRMTLPVEPATEPAPALAGS
jgi:signal transduction histidine kinase